MVVRATSPTADAAFHLDEANLDSGLGVFGMRTPGNEIESPVVFLDAFDLPASGVFVRDYGINGNAFDFIVSNQVGNIRCCSFRMGQNPGEPCR